MALQAKIRRMGYREETDAPRRIMSKSQFPLQFRKLARYGKLDKIFTVEKIDPKTGRVKKVSKNLAQPKTLSLGEAVEGIEYMLNRGLSESQGDVAVLHGLIIRILGDRLFTTWNKLDSKAQSVLATAFGAMPDIADDIEYLASTMGTQPVDFSGYKRKKGIINMYLLQKPQRNALFATPDLSRQRPVYDDTIEPHRASTLPQMLRRMGESKSIVLNPIAKMFGESAEIIEEEEGEEIYPPGMRMRPMPHAPGVFEVLPEEEFDPEEME